MTNKKWNQDAVMNLLKKRKEEEISSYTDQRFWNPIAPKKNKNVYRVRILPNMASGGEAWVKILKHGFQTPSGSWLIENCPATLGLKCPIDEYAGPLFNTGDPKDKNFASKIYRKKNYIANIMVIKDPRDNAVNEGKVFLWRFGQKLFEKLDSALFQPADSGLEQLMFIDPYKGYDLNIVAKLVHDGDKDYPNYDESVFVRESTPIGSSEEKIDEILGSCYDIEGEFLAPKQFKSYDELKKIFDSQVVNFRKSGEESSTSTKTTKKTTVKEEDKEPDIEDNKSTKVTDSKKEAEEDDDAFLKDLEAQLKIS